MGILIVTSVLTVCYRIDHTVILALLFDGPQGAQEMFQELPHIYVEPHELRKAIQCTGNNFYFILHCYKV